MYWIFYAIIVCCCAIYLYLKQAHKKRERQNLFIQTEQSINKIKVDVENLTEEEYKKKLLQQIQSINMNLIELQFQITKQDKQFKKIERNVSAIATILILPIVIGIIVLLISIIYGLDVIQNLL